MPLAVYRDVLALPGVTRLLSFAVLARVPQTAASVVLTLHVVSGLHQGFAAAGLVAAVTTVGMAIGAPWRGRAVDRVGLRRALLPSVLVSTTAWGLAPLAGYRLLLVLAFAGGLLNLPIFTITRQSLSVLVPAHQRRTAFSLDGIGTELSFIIGPTLGVLTATASSTRAALIAVAASTLVVGLGLILLDPPTRSAASAPGPGDASPGAGQPVAERVPRSSWFGPRLVAVLAAAAGATVVLSGMEVAIVAHLRADGAVPLTGVVIAVWSAGSMVGGLVYGTLARGSSPFRLLAALAALTLPVGMAAGPSSLMLAILPSAALCAPVIASTVEGISRLVPEAARGEAMGWHGSALQLGSALGAPLAGAATDAAGAWSGFLAVGAVGALIAGAGLLVGSADRAAFGVLDRIGDGERRAGNVVP